MGEYKTPGIYIKEKNAFGDSIGDTMKNRIGSHHRPAEFIEITFWQQMQESQ